MYIEDAARTVRSKKGYFIQKKAVIISLLLLGVIFAGGIIITYYSTKDTNESCLGNVNSNSSVNQSLNNDQFCAILSCTSPLKITGIYFFSFIFNRIFSFL